jgi:hypothetical protein
MILPTPGEHAEHDTTTDVKPNSSSCQDKDKQLFDI